ncbi:hypothetical protein ACFLU2_02415 [Chloroflexota bacterium]
MKKMCMVLVPLLLLAIVVGTVGCSGETQTPLPVQFSMQVTPQEIADSVSGRRCVFLVTVASDDRAGLIGISASVAGAEVDVIPEAITPGSVAEVMVIPDDASVGSKLTVIVEGERGGVKHTETTSIIVGEYMPTVDELGIQAAKVRDAFVPWLIANYPEFGITAETEWTPTIVRPHFMVVMYYTFYSEDWEMGVRWHVMIPPYDWGEIYLRHRTTEVSPSHAFKIPSLEARAEPELVTPESLVWR